MAASKQKTTWSKIQRESKKREKRAEKAARKEARKYAAEHPELAPADEQLLDGEGFAAETELEESEQPELEPSR